MIGIITTIILITLIIFMFINYQKEEKKSEEESLLIEDSLPKKKTTKKETTEVKVDIKGAINLPGIYSLKTNSRIIDVIEKAGGLQENADTSVINLSKKVTDEMVIIIYTKEEVKKFEETKQKEELVQAKCNQKDENALKNDACIKKEDVKQTGKISLNNATLEELTTLPGIGESKAKEIIAYREKNGPFKSLEELTKVNGIGENILAQIKENLTL